MKKNIALTVIVISAVLFVCVTSYLLRGAEPSFQKQYDYRQVSPISAHGQLSVAKNKVVDQQGQVVSFAGVSLFWANKDWEGEQFYNKDVVNYLRYEFGSPIVRIAVGVEADGGYIQNPEFILDKVYAVADAAIEADLYFIVDWHTHKAEEYRDEAVEFFTRIARRYGHTPNIIYETYNEPARAEWVRDIKPYSKAVISAIRKIDPSNIIIVGTPTWSQYTYEAALAPIQGEENIAYSLHFYADTHWGRFRLYSQFAINLGLPLIVTEWGFSDVYGEEPANIKSTKSWLKFMQSNQLINCVWSFHNKDETLSLLKPGTKYDGNWSDTDFTEAGLLARDIIRSWPNLPDTFKD